MIGFVVMKAVQYMQCLETSLQTSNMQGHLARVLCNIGTVHPRLYHPHTEMQLACMPCGIVHVLLQHMPCHFKTRLMYSLGICVRN